MTDNYFHVDKKKTKPKGFLKCKMGITVGDTFKCLTETFVKKIAEICLDERNHITGETSTTMGSESRGNRGKGDTLKARKILEEKRRADRTSRFNKGRNIEEIRILDDVSNIFLEPPERKTDTFIDKMNELQDLLSAIHERSRKLRQPAQDHGKSQFLCQSTTDAFSCSSLPSAAGLTFEQFQDYIKGFQRLQDTSSAADLFRSTKDTEEPSSCQFELCVMQSSGGSLPSGVDRVSTEDVDFGDESSLFENHMMQYLIKETLREVSQEVHPHNNGSSIHQQLDKIKGYLSNEDAHVRVQYLKDLITILRTCCPSCTTHVLAFVYKNIGLLSSSLESSLEAEVVQGCLVFCIIVHRFDQFLSPNLINTVASTLLDKSSDTSLLFSWTFSCLCFMLDNSTNIWLLDFAAKNCSKFNDVLLKYALRYAKHVLETVPPYDVMNCSPRIKEILMTVSNRRLGKFDSDTQAISSKLLSFEKLNTDTGSLCESWDSISQDSSIFCRSSSSHRLQDSACAFVAENHN